LPDEIETLKLTEEELATGKFCKGAGCSECRGSGYKGRIGVFELLMATPKIRAAMARNADFPTMLALAKEQGFRTMMDDGRYKVVNGWTTPEEVIKAVFTQAID
jgi:type II secretory ATPase GspE/PulE/Tfp pilus assembly ATPase PilB-like protein